MNYLEMLEAIRMQYGKLTPEVVLEVARPVDSPIHSFVFDKEPGEAAEAYYLSRAHELIQRVRVTVQDNNEEKRSIRYFLAVPSDSDRYVYEPFSVVVSDQQKLDLVRLEAMRRLRDAESAVNDLDILAAGTPFGGPSKRAKAALRKARKELADVA